MQKRLGRTVVVGAALAGLRTAEALRREGYAGELVLIGEERHEPYDRPPLSKAFLGAEAGDTAPLLRQASDLHARWYLGVRAESLDASNATVALSDHTELEFDGLVVATGLRSRPLPGVPVDGARVHTLRTVADAQRLRAQLEPGRRIVIVGAGFIGSELASTCRARELEVTVLAPEPLLTNALGELGHSATARARRHGVTVHDDVLVTGTSGSDSGVDLQLSNGASVVADVVVVAVGSIPNVEWLEGSGLKVEDGLVCDSTLAAEGHDAIVGAGDIARWPHPALGGELLRLEHWTNATEQARAAARRLLGSRQEPFAPVPSFWSDQFGVRIQGVGLPRLADEVQVVEGRADSDAFVAEYRRSGHLVGAVVAGSPAALLPYRQELAVTMRGPLPR